MPNLTLGELNRQGAVVSGVAQGTATAPRPLGTVAKSAEQLYFSTSATSGSSRVINARLYFNAAGEGEAVRAYGIVNNATAAVGGTVNGIHTTLQVSGASGHVSGAGNAIRATLALGNGTTSGGTLSALQLDSDFDNGATVPSTASCIRVTNTNTKLWANLMTIPAPVNGSIFAAHTTQTMTQSIRILGATGTPYYVMCTDAATNRS